MRRTRDAERRVTCDVRVGAWSMRVLPLFPKGRERESNTETRKNKDAPQPAETLISLEGRHADESTDCNCT